MLVLHRAEVKPGQTILIHGASGGVGLALCQVAHAWGLTVVGTTSHEEGAKLVRACGARLVLNHKDPEHTTHLLVRLLAKLDPLNLYQSLSDNSKRLLERKSTLHLINFQWVFSRFGTTMTSISD